MLHERSQSRLVIGERLIAEALSYDRWLGIRNRAKPHGAVRIVQPKVRLAACAFPPELPADVQAPLPQHPRRELEPSRAVMVAGNHEDRHLNIENEAREDVIEERHRVHRRQGAVVHIARHENRVGLRVTRQLDELIEHVRLIVGEMDPVEEAP
jgi:hypothetical protein